MFFFNAPQRYVYGLWRVSTENFTDKNWLWKIRRIFQVWTDQAIAYIRCYQTFFISFLNSIFPEQYLIPQENFLQSIPY